METERINLIGLWNSDPKDLASVREYGRVSLDFRPDGQLIYTIYQENKREVMLLVYRVQGDFLFTDQPSSPREERTRFEIHGDALTLYYESHHPTYIRTTG